MPKFDFANDVEVSESRLDHEHVRSLHDVPVGGAHGEAAAAHRQLVALPVPEGRGRVRRVPERTVELGGKLDGVGHDGDPVGRPDVLQHVLDGLDTAIHHVCERGNTVDSVGRMD